MAAALTRANNGRKRKFAGIPQTTFAERRIQLRKGIDPLHYQRQMENRHPVAPRARRPAPFRRIVPPVQEYQQPYTDQTAPRAGAGSYHYPRHLR